MALHGPETAEVVQTLDVSGPAAVDLVPSEYAAFLPLKITLLAGISKMQKTSGNGYVCQKVKWLVDYGPGYI